MWCIRISSLLLLIGICESYKILLISPLNGKSHIILNDSIVKHLIKAGHEVTYITAVPENLSNRERVKNIDVSVDMEIMKVSHHPEIALWNGKKCGLNFSEKVKMLSIKSIMDNSVNFQDLKLFYYMILDDAKRTLSHKAVQDLLKDKSQHFDVVIAEWMFTEIYAGFSAVYKCPLIWFSTVEPHWMVLRLIDEAFRPAYSLAVLSTYLFTPLTFSQRAGSLYELFQIYYLYETLVYVQEEDLYKQYLLPHIKTENNIEIPLQVLRYNASLVLGNSHVSLEEAQRLPLSYKPIEGYHIERDVEPLPKDFKKIMDNAKSGVIYFSMGTNLKSKDFPNEVITSLLTYFGTLEQTVIWKFEEVLPNRPKNVHIMTWAPQQSILAHPNCILFISHGGLLSTSEAIHFGVPIVGIPVFGDQFVNVQRAVLRGFAKQVDLSYNMVEKLEVQVNNILKEPKYTAKVKELSFIYHDRPVTPGAELVHWVEHVVKTRGAPHLRSTAPHVSLYQKLYLDVFVLILLTFLSGVLVMKKIYFKVLSPSSSNKKIN